MAVVREKRDPMRLMWRRIGAFTLLIVIGVVLRGVWGVYGKARDSSSLRLEAEAKLQDLQDREESLRADIASLKSGRGIEAELRERYDLAAEGEGVIVLVDPPATKAEPKQTALQRFTSWFSW